VLGVFSDHDMSFAGAGKAPTPCLLGEGRSIPPSPSEAVWKSSAESPIMAWNRNGGPLWVEPMMAASEPSLLGERLRPPKQTAINSRLRKQMVSLSGSHRPTGVHHPERRRALMREPSECLEENHATNLPT
jgi:hypothetical protein